MYYAMKNCNADAKALKAYVVNTIDHYKLYVVAQFYPTHKRFIPSKNIKLFYACNVYFNSNRVIILNATKSRDASRRVMSAARSLLLVKGLLLHTGKLLKGRQSTKMLLIMPWY